MGHTSPVTFPRRLRQWPLCAISHPAAYLGACRSYSSSSGSKDETDPYRLLGLERSASADDIKAAYRKQAMKWHPDKQPPEKREEAQKKFSAIANAYEVLSDPQKKRQFDSGMHNPSAGPSFTGGFPPGFQHGGFSTSRHSPETAEKLFREVFGSAAFEEMLGQILGGVAQVQLQVGMEVKVLSDYAQVLKACRQSGIDSTNDTKRRQALGHVAKIIKVDPRDNSIKLRFNDLGDVWFGAKAVQHSGTPRANSFGGMQDFFGTLGSPRGGGGTFQQVQQQVVTLPNGRRVLRVTRRIRMPDGSVKEEVIDSPT